MPTNLTNNTITSTYNQLLHVDGGPDGTLKTIYSGTGTGTAVKISTSALSVDNIQFDGNVISTTNTNGNLYLTPNGTGQTIITNVDFTGTTTYTGTQVNGGNLRLTGNTLSSTDTNGNVIVAPNGTGDIQLDADTVRIGDSGASATLTTNGAGSLTINTNGGTATGSMVIATGANGDLGFLADGTGKILLTGNTAQMGVFNTNTTLTTYGTGDLILNTNNGTNSGTIRIYDGANGNIDLTPNGTGTVNVSKIAVTAGTVPFNTITNLAYAAFSDVTDQTGSTTAATAVKFGTTEVAGAGITMVTDGSNLTRLTFADAGTYMVVPSLQLVNSDTTDHDATVWFTLSGSNVVRSATKVTVPKAADGGHAVFNLAYYITVTAGQYVQVQWLPEHIGVTLDHTAAVAGPPAVPAIPSAIVVAQRIA